MKVQRYQLRSRVVSIEVIEPPPPDTEKHKRKRDELKKEKISPLRKQRPLTRSYLRELKRKCDLLKCIDSECHHIVKNVSKSTKREKYGIDKQERNNIKKSTRITVKHEQKHDLEGSSGNSPRYDLRSRKRPFKVNSPETKYGWKRTKRNPPQNILKPKKDPSNPNSPEQKYNAGSFKRKSSRSHYRQFKKLPSNENSPPEQKYDHESSKRKSRYYLRFKKSPSNLSSPPEQKYDCESSKRKLRHIVRLKKSPSNLNSPPEQKCDPQASVKNYVQPRYDLRSNKLKPSPSKARYIKSHPPTILLSRISLSEIERLTSSRSQLSQKTKVVIKTSPTIIKKTADLSDAQVTPDSPEDMFLTRNTQLAQQEVQFSNGQGFTFIQIESPMTIKEDSQRSSIMTPVTPVTVMPTNLGLKLESYAIENDAIPEFEFSFTFEEFEHDDDIPDTTQSLKETTESELFKETCEHLDEVPDTTESAKEAVGSNIFEEVCADFFSTDNKELFFPDHTDYDPVETTKFLKSNMIISRFLAAASLIVGGRLAERIKLTFPMLIPKVVQHPNEESEFFNHVFEKDDYKHLAIGFLNQYEQTSNFNGSHCSDEWKILETALIIIRTKRQHEMITTNKNEPEVVEVEFLGGTEVMA